MKLLFVLILVIVFAGGTLQCSIESYNKMYQFSMNLFSSIAKKTNGNFVIAPTSIWANLMLLTKGASGETLKELMKIQTKKRCRKKYLKTLISRQTVEAYNLQSLRCAAFVVDRNMSLEYIGKIRFDDGVLLIAVSKNKILEGVEAINSLISTATREQVKNAVTADFLNRTSVRVFDVNVLQTVMKIPLSIHSTGYIDFRDKEGEVIGRVKVMNKTDAFKLTSLDIECIVVEIPVPSANDLSMLIFLPHRGVSVNTIIERMKNKKLDNVLKKLHISKLSKMTLLMPILEIQTNASLEWYLRGLGLTKMFQQSSAEFSNMGDEKYHVSAINHYAEIQLKEEEIERIEVPPERNILTVSVNRPFVFMIVESNSNIVFYAGIFSNPDVSFT